MALLHKVLAAALAATAITALAAPAASANPLTLIVGYAPGGASDRIARLVAERLQQRSGAPVIVENKSGAGGRLAAQWMQTAGPDVLMLANPAVMVVAPLVYGQAGYAPQNFPPVALVSRYEFGLVVPASSSIQDFGGLQAWLKQHPKEFNLGVPATGSLPHFFSLMLADAIGQQPEVVGYRGSTPLLNDVIGGVLNQAIDTLDTLLPQVRAGKIRLLAVSGAKRLEAAPQVPTFRELGLPLQADGWNAFFAPPSMPPEQVQKLGREIAEIMADPAMQAKVKAIDLEPVSQDAAATAATLKAYREQWEPVVRASGFKAEQ